MIPVRWWRSPRATSAWAVCLVKNCERLVIVPKFALFRLRHRTELAEELREYFAGSRVLGSPSRVCQGDVRGKEERPFFRFQKSHQLQSLIVKRPRPLGLKRSEKSFKTQSNSRAVYLRRTLKILRHDLSRRARTPFVFHPQRDRSLGRPGPSHGLGPWWL